jgi:hypothetical protein
MGGMSSISYSEINSKTITSIQAAKRLKILDFNEFSDINCVAYHARKP